MCDCMHQVCVVVLFLWLRFVDFVDQTPPVLCVRSESTARVQPTRAGTGTLVPYLYATAHPS
jgi:hypothetical protein